jgi:two-component system cell cycle response regulator
VCRKVASYPYHDCGHPALMQLARNNDCDIRMAYLSQVRNPSRAGCVQRGCGATSASKYAESGIGAYCRPCMHVTHGREATADTVCEDRQIGNLRPMVATTSDTEMSLGADPIALAHRANLALLAPPTILFVDADDLCCMPFHGIAAAAGFDVRTVPDGHQALAILQKGGTSIVVMDPDNAARGSLELCRRIRAHQWPEYVYIVFLSNRDNGSEIDAAFEAGADDYVSKQTSALQFQTRLRTAMRVVAFERSSKQALARTRQLEITDPLTGAFNRRYFKRHLRRELKRIQRCGGTASLLLLEIDHFKQLVAEHGNAVGDVILKELLRLVAACFRRDTDWCVRLGKRAFAVVLEGTKVKDASAYAQVVRQTIADAVVCTSAGNLRITASIGVSGLEDMSDAQSTTVNALLGRARTNLYASVLSGCNRVTLSDSLEHVLWQASQAPGIPIARIVVPHKKN